MRVCSVYVVSLVKSSKTKFWPRGLLQIAQSPELYGTTRSCHVGLMEDSLNNNGKLGRTRGATLRLAQDAIMEYLHLTRGLPFMDAEFISKNSPQFLDRLLQKIDAGENIGASISRFLRYHPINEFEPFFESLGLSPSDYVQLLPRERMFLIDDQLLLENYHVLCEYGIAREKMGRVYREAPEIFRYDRGLLMLKINAYEKLGLSQSTMAKVIAASPYLLTGDVDKDFVEVLENLKNLGFQFTLIEENISEEACYRWSQILELLCFFSKIGCNEEQLSELIRRHPGILFEGSGDKTCSLIVYLLKFGSSVCEIRSMFLQFPNVQVGKFLSNLRRCFLFLTEIDMPTEDVSKILRSHSLWLGECTLKKPNTVFARLNVGKKRLCKIIEDHPTEMKNWVLGSQMERLPDKGKKLLKVKFLLGLGFTDDLTKISEAAKLFRGKAEDLQERFDCIVSAGLDRQDVIKMLTVCPKILNMSKDVIEMKMDFLMNELGWPLTALVKFPAFLGYKIQRIKLRHSMYSWLKDQGAADPDLALSTFIGCSDRKFVRQFVNRHPSGPEVWQKLNKKFAHAECLVHAS
ncbi:transcription termination factor MTEF18, mitochondrial-like [Rhodamnia argentea]|uniref:Transcription termination factor MTEF18, mitochondrial-like n=1 Tax=Rhodamnia argentea TaxID=178133 RepID=A0A8B8NB12_9MYRT|nr:transcription termination factor MTEF18, mitochondrial-like [Rhodamnia argentea]XP_030519640.1 transcription termination factor MTEF18, mitochondrial-like [Rhodamnia argentea]